MAGWTVLILVCQVLAFILVSFFVEEEGGSWIGNPKDRDGRVWMPTVEKPKLKHIQAISKDAASLACNLMEKLFVHSG